MNMQQIILKNKQQIFNNQLKTFISMMFLTLTSSCSVFNEGEYSSKEISNKFNKEIIGNFSKAMSKNAENYLFYLERGRAKHDFGDYVGAIKDFNSSLSLNPDLKIIFDIANSKYSYGDYKGAIEDYKKLILNEDFKDEIFIRFLPFLLNSFKFNFLAIVPAKKAIAL